jgi:large subunit ribosomal protein L28
MNRCDYCGKMTDYGHNVSHAKNRTQRLRKPNLHSVRVVEDGDVIRRKLCAKCIRMAKRPHEKMLGSKKTETPAAASV